METLSTSFLPCLYSQERNGIDTWTLVTVTHELVAIQRAAPAYTDSSTERSVHWGLLPNGRASTADGKTVICPHGRKASGTFQRVQLALWFQQRAILVPARTHGDISLVSQESGRPPEVLIRAACEEPEGNACVRSLGPDRPVEVYSFGGIPCFRDARTTRPWATGFVPGAARSLGHSAAKSLSRLPLLRAKPLLPESGG